MIDYIRIINLEPFKLDYNKCTDTDTYITVNSDTSEITNKQHSFELGLKVSNNKIEGSIHQYFNNLINNSHIGNSNDFNYNQLVATIDFLDDKFDLNNHQNKLTTLEFGFNIKPKACATEIIKENVKFYQFKIPTEELFKTKRASKFFKLTDYRIKVYDKAKQYGIVEDNVLRIEVHYKTKQFKKFGITTLKDLRDRDKLDRMFDDYLLKFDDLFIIDSLSKVKDKSKRRELKCLLYDISENNFNNNTAKMRAVKKLKTIVKEERLNTTKNYLKGLLINKFDELLYVTDSSYSKL